MIYNIFSSTKPTKRAFLTNLTNDPNLTLNIMLNYSRNLEDLSKDIKKDNLTLIF